MTCTGEASGTQWSFDLLALHHLMSTQFTSLDDAMLRAMELARRGEGCVEPNPMVGAVVVDDDMRLLGEGWHERFGGPHAEVHAIRTAGDRCRGATLVVTLEPCSHQGKTPPCVDQVLAAGFRRVVIGAIDPNPSVHGSGIQKLREAGVEVVEGVRSAEARELIAPFITFMREQRPYVHAKWAMSLDGRIAARTGQSQWISNEASRAVAHQLRGRMDAILVGVGTVLVDDPQLTARPPGPRRALRVVLDGRGRTPIDCRVTRDLDVTPTLIVTTTHSSAEWRGALESRRVEVLVSAESSPDHRVAIEPLLSELHARQVTNLLVEGGSAVLGSFHDAGLIDECHCFVAPKLIGGNAALSPLGGLGHDAPEAPFSRVEIRELSGDVYLRGWRQRSP
jgi:diaminohydroxyphosphoribosylaminopyrimidine deaminase/5-amino-6-(5-phosphoribosylamino)uracil reductase